MNCVICGLNLIRQGDSLDCLNCNSYYHISDLYLGGINLNQDGTKFIKLSRYDKKIYIISDWEVENTIDVSEYFEEKRNYTDQEIYDFLIKFYDNLIFQ